MSIVGSRALVAVAQIPFVVTSESGAVHTFGTLVPVMKTDGTQLASEDCPREGLIFWMLRPNTARLAQPGRLLLVTLEPARRHDLQHDFQAQPETVERPDDIAEILTADVLSVREPRDIVNNEDWLNLDHPPTNLVLVQWGEDVFGPFRTNAVQDGARWRASLQSYYEDKSVLKMPLVDFHNPNKLGQFFKQANATVSLEDSSPTRSDSLLECEYRLLLTGGFRKLPSMGYPRVSLESDRDVLSRFTKRFAVRRKQQELKALLDELSLAADASGLSTTPRERDVFNAIKARAGRISEEDYALAKSLVESGLIEDRIKTALTERTERYIRENSAALGSDISKRVENLQNELDALERKKDSLQDSLDTRELELDRELDKKREESDREIAAQRAQIDNERQDLEKQRDDVGKTLQQLTTQFTDSRDELITRYLALTPLLQTTGIQLETASSNRPAKDAGDLSRLQHFDLPAFVTQGGGAASALTEQEFFERFEEHVKNRNFSYRRKDLAAFHISVKCSDITILGGWSGTGKSSLPLLYMEAAGGEDSDAINRYLRVDVSPSWLDMRDVLGHLNSIERQFQPAESGLYQHLIHASAEFDRRQQDSGVYIVTLDEMNLAHVEHYFSGFLQALEQPLKQRTVRCFDAASVDQRSPFLRYAELRVPRSVRFIGTVNFDETTKQLSQRLLDRANLVRLGAGEPYQVQTSDRESSVSVRGTPLRLKHLREWTHAAVLDKPLASLLDTLRRHLHQLGCPVTPRRLRAIADFVASTPPWLMKSAEAFDLQIAQRLLPQVRGLFRPGARASLDAIERSLQEQQGFDESLQALEELKRSEESSLPFGDSTLL